MILNVLYAKKRRDRWWRFNTLKKAFIRAEAADSKVLESKALALAFQRLGYGAVPQDLSNLWHDLVSLGASRRQKLDDSHIAHVEALVEKLAPQLLSVLGWLDLYHLSIGLGLYLPASSLRSKALAKALEDAEIEQSLEQICMGFYAAVEQGHFDKAWQLLELMKELGCAPERHEQAEWLLGVLSRSQNNSSPGFVSSAEPVDLAFGRDIEGKRVALVGPAPSSVTQGTDIDSHDVVVKFSYRGGEKGRDPETQGQRLDVSYYNNTQAKALSESDFDSVLKTLHWGVCINRKGRSHFPDDYPNIRKLTSFQWLLLDTHFNAGPNAVLDLLRFNPSGIRVFNTDLMLSAGRFSGYRLAKSKPIDYTRSFIKTHDPVLQYQIMKQLWDNGLISGDARFDDVMSMGVRKYLQQLQNAHGAREQALF